MDRVRQEIGGLLHNVMQNVHCKCGQQHLLSLSVAGKKILIRLAKKPKGTRTQNTVLKRINGYFSIALHKKKRY